jgi:beta-lactam-binding protein with PASTA domain
MAQTIGLKLKFYAIRYPYPTDHCFGQWPSPGQPIKNGTLVCYIIAQEQENLVIYPDFRGQTLESVVAIFTSYGITHYQTDITPEQGKIYYIHEQHPKAGTILNLQEPAKLHVQLKIGLKPGKVAH